MTGLIRKGGSLDLHGGEPFWLARDGLGLVVPALETDLSCDVLILGGGVTGALVADSLSQAGLNVVLLDRRHLGRGSTAASTALLQYDIDTPLHQLRETFGKAKADRAYQLGIEAIEIIEQISRGTSNGFHKRPSLYVARDEAAAASLKEEFDARRDAGLAVEWLAAEAVREEYGFEVCAAIRSAIAGEVDPFRLTQTLLSRSMERGVQIFDRTEVAEIDESDGVVTVRCESGHFVRARWIVHATGYEAVETLPRRIVSLHSTFAMISEPVRSSVLTWWDQALVWEYANPYHYARWVDDRIVYGGGDVSFRHAAARDGLIEKKSEELRAAFESFCPDVSFQPAFSWAGTFGSTKDGLGYIGAPPERPRSLYALGFGGNGITYSAIARRILTNQILGRRDLDAELFTFGR